MSTTIDTVALATEFSGQLLQPADPRYDEARRAHNGLIDRHPALIARCSGTADIADAVKLARELNLEAAVRGGGHDVAGRATIRGGLPIITGGLGAHPLPRGVEVLKFFREVCESAPDEMMIVAGLRTAPDGSGAKVVGIAVAHCGPLVDGETAVRPIKAFGPPVMD